MFGRPCLSIILANDVRLRINILGQASSMQVDGRDRDQLGKISEQIYSFREHLFAGLELVAPFGISSPV